MEKEDERKKRIKEYAEVLAYFIDNPDQVNYPTASRGASESQLSAS